MKEVFDFSLFNRAMGTDIPNRVVEHEDEKPVVVGCFLSDADEAYKKRMEEADGSYDSQEELTDRGLSEQEELFRRVRNIIVNGKDEG